MRNVVNVLSILLLSALTGGIVGGSFGLAVPALMGEAPSYSLAYGLLSGALIGLAAGSAFMLLSNNAGRRPLLSFCMVAMIIALGTAAGNLISGLPPGWLFFVIVVSAEILGLSATFFWYGSYRRWNVRLQTYRRRNDVDSPPDSGSERTAPDSGRQR
jgi:hypothetical protein